MTSQTTLGDMIIELLRAYPIDPSDGLLQAGLRMEFGAAVSKGRIRVAAAELARTGLIDISPRTSGPWRYSLNP